MSNRLEEALHKADAELFAELGRRAYVYEGQIIHKLSGGEDPEDEKNGRRVFNVYLAEIKTAVCEDWQACEKLDTYADETTLTAALYDFFVAAQLAILPPITIAVLTVRYGIKHLCNC